MRAKPVSACIMNANIVTGRTARATSRAERAWLREVLGADAPETP
ncbi:hypothetical protein [Streptomyces sp. NPDC017958]